MNDGGVYSKFGFVKEVLLIHGVGEQVETLSRELSWIQAFLKDANGVVLQQRIKSEALRA